MSAGHPCSGWLAGVTCVRGGRGERVKLREFKRMVEAAFGPNMENATPSNVREFLDRLQAKAAPAEWDGRFHINESAASYEEILRDFFARALERPREEAIIALWTFALELAFADLYEVLEDRFGPLFRGIEEPPEGRR
jgi:hypothetical protein